MADRVFRITKENAAEFSKKAQAARRLKRDQKAVYALPEPFKPAESTANQESIAGMAGNEDDYLRARLTCVREQLRRIDHLMLHETSGKELQALATAQAKLAEQERIMRGSPLPGSLRPDLAQKRGTGTASID